LENVLTSLCIQAPEYGSEPPMESIFISALNYVSCFKIWSLVWRLFKFSRRL